jgi:flagellar protein FliJ
MKKFTFKLQALLNYRNAKEKEIEGELAGVIGKQNRERLKREEMVRSIENEKALYSKRVKEGDFNPKEAILFEKYVDISRKAVGLTDRRIEAMEPEINRIRGKLLEARRDKMVIEKIREKRYNEYMYNVNREIAKENDDMNQKIYMRKMSAGESEL